MQRIEDRLSILEEKKKRKIEMIAKEMTPSFTPTINKTNMNDNSVYSIRN